MLMAKLLQELQLHGKVKIDLVFLVMNPGYNEDNWNIILNNAKLLGIPINVFESDIFNIVADVDKSPCYLWCENAPRLPLLPRKGAWLQIRSHWGIISMM